MSVSLLLSCLGTPDPYVVKERDLEALADAVKKENERLEAYRRSRIS